MKRNWYGRDVGLSTRMFITMFLLGALYLAFLTVLWSAGVDYLSMVIIAGILLAVQYFMSDKLALWSMGAKEVTMEQEPRLHGMIERLSVMAGIPKPRVAIAKNSMPNAFATGRNPSKSVVAVTTALMERLDEPEIEAVLAHELTHVKNRDVAVITLASFFSTVAFFIMRISMFAGMGSGFGGRRSRDQLGQALMLVYLASIVVWLISFFLIRALSRYRELAADRGSAILTGAPSHLASALMKISDTMKRIPEQDLRQAEGMNAFFIIPAIRGSSLMELFSTHPSLERRLEQLRKMEMDMERH
ncbi:MAG: zinc metalloprotease HtpX [Dehalococcoidia bacterium]|nr:zinc metalloprotease HtpX [Dehalococcoidia bacterium]